MKFCGFLVLALLAVGRAQNNSPETAGKKSEGESPNTRFHGGPHSVRPGQHGVGGVRPVQTGFGQFGVGVGGVRPSHLGVGQLGVGGRPVHHGVGVGGLPVHPGVGAGGRPVHPGVGHPGVGVGGRPVHPGLGHPGVGVGGLHPGVGVGGLHPGVGHPGVGVGGLHPGVGHPGVGVGGVNPGLVRPPVQPGQISGPDDPFQPVTGCDKYVRNSFGKWVCDVDQKPFECPIVRGQCPDIRFGPSPCRTDNECARDNKCCYDQCLKHNVCKPPEHFGK